MRKRVCKRCGAVYETDRPDTYFCPACSAASHKEAPLRERTCKQCGAVFTGGPRAWYCPTCRKQRKRAAEKRYREKGPSRKIGSIDRCVKCGAEYIVNSARQVYCKDCADETVKETVRAHKRQYNADRSDELNMHKTIMRTDRKVCVVCGKIFDADTTTVTCSPECAAKRKKYRSAVADYKRGKRKTLPEEANGGNQENKNLE